MLASLSGFSQSDTVRIPVRYARLALMDLVSYDTTVMAWQECEKKMLLLDSLQRAIIFERSVSSQLIKQLQERIDQYDLMTVEMDKQVQFHAQLAKRYKRQRTWYPILAGVGTLVGGILLINAAVP